MPIGGSIHLVDAMQEIAGATLGNGWLAVDEIADDGTGRVVLHNGDRIAARWTARTAAVAMSGSTGTETVARCFGDLAATHERFAQDGHRAEVDRWVDERVRLAGRAGGDALVIGGGSGRTCVPLLAAGMTVVCADAARCLRFRDARLRPRARHRAMDQDLMRSRIVPGDDGETPRFVERAGRPGRPALDARAPGYVPGPDSTARRPPRARALRTAMGRLLVRVSPNDERERA